ncbi:MAG: glutathione S-transferase family protein [Gammaproteobacteria bacterium]|jgi:glutathione S-transferase|nr:glutathione S-transferase family protein [Gammaproteobacteria bacterium]MBT5201840.1 glutathione S-transferase family protein [Gammaproteobacteria bacterium]MBT5604254.1 glutathione S-transferase family protein [Gammaproteobacteria bacterium]MBT6245045.1 glutathione S-transferase family protein [Gammaproteobacteria bacterium]
MILVGRDLSPFVRRCAIVMNLLGLEYERKIVAAAQDAELIKRYNPLGRVPALILADEVVIDSHAIIDYLLDTYDEAEALLAKTGDARRQALKINALAVGTMEKAVASAYERTLRPKEFIYGPYLTKLNDQVAAGLEALDLVCPSDSWIGGATPGLVDVSAVVAFDQAGIVLPELQGIAGNLATLSVKSEGLAAFLETRWVAP